MLYSLDWLKSGKAYPPSGEVERLRRYKQNAALFNSEHFSESVFRNRSGEYGSSSLEIYSKCCSRISRVVGNFDDVFSIPILLNYQRFISMKMADLVAGEHPKITGATPEENAKIKWIVDNTNLNAQLYAAVVDISRYGDCPVRLYKNPLNDFYTFTIWDAGCWFPIVSQDGTNSITHHVLVAFNNQQPDEQKSPDWYMQVQIHEVAKPGQYISRIYHNGPIKEVIGKLESETPILTGLSIPAVFNIRAFEVSGTVYGYDDYVPLDSLLAEIIVRVSQISSILDKHADPAMTGPVSMLRKDSTTGEMYLQRGKFYGITEGDTPPAYLVWDGQLSAAFQQLEFLINQLYILSEMGAALAGGVNDSANAVTGSAMRFKLVNPLAKARRVCNALTFPLRKIISAIGSGLPEISEETGEPGSGEDTPLPFGHISVRWEDGLPNDPREQIEMTKLASGEQKLVPLEDALMAYLGKSGAEAKTLAMAIRDQEEEAQQNAIDREVRKAAEQAQVNKPGPQDGTGVNPQRKGGKVGTFQAENNKRKE